MPTVSTDLTGKRFGRLIVLGRAEPYMTPSTGGLLSVWHCKCDCGTEKLVRRSHLVGGNTVSCGCYRNTHRFRDISGSVFGWLTVISHVGKRHDGNALWECRCRCGNTIVLPERTLVHAGKGSCGCAGANEAARPVKARYIRYRTSAQERGIAFTLSKGDIADITEQPCYYCGDLTGAHNGIDRLDSTQGYTRENSVPCCWVCNRAKGNMSAADYKEWAVRLCSHLFRNGASHEQDS